MTSVFGKNLGLWELTVACREIAASKGFDKTTWDNYPTKVMLVVTELDEVVTAQHSMCDMEEELADVGIRICTMLGDFECNPENYVGMREVGNFVVASRNFESLHSTLWPILHMLTASIEAWRKGQTDTALHQLKHALKRTFEVAEQIGFDLMRAMHDKARKNAKRERLHGKLRSE